jgi:hypothetical protein
MIMDKTLEFADNADIAAVAGTYNLTDVVDLGSQVKDIGTGNTLYLVVQCVNNFAGAGTVTFQLASDSTSAIDTGGAQSIHWASQPTAIADLVAGYNFTIALPSADPDYEQYLGVQAVLSGTVTTANVNAFLTETPHKWRAYPQGQN